MEIIQQKKTDINQSQISLLLWIATLHKVFYTLKFYKVP